MSLIRSWGLEDSTLTRACARPAAFIINAEGRIVWTHFPENWRQRLNRQDYELALARAGLRLEATDQP